MLKLLYIIVISIAMFAFTTVRTEFLINSEPGLLNHLIVPQEEQGDTTIYKIQYDNGIWSDSLYRGKFGVWFSTDKLINCELIGIEYFLNKRDTSEVITGFVDQVTQYPYGLFPGTKLRKSSFMFSMDNDIVTYVDLVKMLEVVKVNPDSGLFIGYDNSKRQALGYTDINNPQQKGSRSYKVVVDSTGQIVAYDSLYNGRNIGIRAVFRCIKHSPIKEELTFRLQWDDKEADLDLMLFETNPLTSVLDTINWDCMKNRYGGSLNVDDTYGYGPEIITHPVISDSLKNTAQLIVHYYGPGNGEETKATIIIKINDKQIYKGYCYLNPLDYWNIGQIDLKSGKLFISDSCNIQRNIMLKLKE